MSAVGSEKSKMPLKMQKRAALETALFLSLSLNGQNHLGTARFCLLPMTPPG